jgi:hypothetical protein
MTDAVVHVATFTFRIEGIAPAGRLAAYLDEFARLLGEEASTRFEGILEGSTRIAARPLPIALPKEAARDRAQDDACRAMDRLDTMLTEDNANGPLSEDGQHWDHPPLPRRERALPDCRSARKRNEPPSGLAFVYRQRPGGRK